jgi:CheY-like chemotaxis protein
MDKIKVLLVDDDEVDYMNVKRAFKKNALNHSLEYRANGLDAINYLKEIVNAEDLPQVILLDINMPKMNGHEFLEELRKDDRLKHIVVYVLTTSSQNSDIDKAYDKQVSGYLVKPLDFDEFKGTIKKLDDLWTIQKFSNS